MGELAGPRGLTEGVWFVEWRQLKATNDTPFAAIAALPPEGAARQRGLWGGFHFFFAVTQRQSSWAWVEVI